MTKKRKMLHNMLAKWSLSYVVISTIAIIVISFCVMKYSEALRAEMRHSNAILLETVQMQMDKTVGNLRTFSSKANLNDTVRLLRQCDNYEDIPRYELYTLVRELANDTISETDSNHGYIYFPHIDLMVSGAYYNRSKEFYDITFHESGFSYEDWFTIVSGSYKTDQIFSLPTKEGRELTVLVRPVDSSNRQGYPANVIIVLDMNQFLQSNTRLKQERDSLSIVDYINKKVISNSELEQEVEDYLLSGVMEGREGSLNADFPAGRTVVSYIHSKYENWDYVIATTELAYVKQISDLQRLVVTTIIMYVIVSGCVMVYSTTRHFKPLQKLVDKLGTQMEDLGENWTADAYEYINHSINKLVVQNKESSNVIGAQRSAIANELLHRLLTAEKPYEIPTDEILINYGIDIGEKNHQILAYLPVETQNGAGTEDEIIWFILRNVTEENLKNTGLECIPFREGNIQTFLVLSDQDEKEIREIVKMVARISSEFIMNHFKISYRIAFSEVHSRAGEVRRDFREIRKVFEYQKSTVYGGVTSYGDINILPGDTMLKYPMDVENRLFNYISVGDAERACDIIHPLLLENWNNCLMPEAMQFLISNITGTMVRAYTKTVRGDVPFSQKYLMEVCAGNELEKVQEELEKVVHSVCANIRELSGKERVEQKSRLYQMTREYVEHNYTDSSLSVNDIADLFGVHPTYLSKMFKDMEGENLSQYISRVRLDHVKALLLEGNRLEDVAVRCGYGSQRTFLRIFKQYTGLTPTQYRELEEKKKEGMEP